MSEHYVRAQQHKAVFAASQKITLSELLQPNIKDKQWG